MWQSNLFQFIQNSCFTEWVIRKWKICQQVFNFVMSQVLSLHETLASYGSVYYVGTVLPVSSILLGYVIKPRKPTRSKAHKAQWVLRKANFSSLSSSPTSGLGSDVLYYPEGSYEVVPLCYGPSMKVLILFSFTCYWLSSFDLESISSHSFIKDLMIVATACAPWRSPWSSPGRDNCPVSYICRLVTTEDRSVGSESCIPIQNPLHLWK